MHKRKLSERDKYRHDIYDLTDSLKKYLKEDCESLVTKEIVEHVNKICDNAHWLEHNTRLRVMTITSDIPKMDTLIFLVRHVPDESEFSSKEATIFEEKTEESEQTKLYTVDI